MSPDELWDREMEAALELAAEAGRHGEVPVGAVVLVGRDVVAEDRNRREELADPTAHAELLALRHACKAAGSWRLTAATVVVSLEPCVMCAGALVAARVRRVVYAAANTEAGALGSLYNVGVDPRLPHQIEVVGGVRSAEAASLLTDFFGDRRASPAGTSAGDRPSGR